MKIEKFHEMLEEIQRERHIQKEALLEAIQAALILAVKKLFKPEEEIEARISESGEFGVFKKLPDGEEKDVTPKDFGRLAAQTAKQVIIQRIREAEKEEIYEEIARKQGEIINGIVQRREYGGYLVNLGRLEIVLPAAEMIPGEILKDREHVKLYLVEVKKTGKTPLVIISRAHPGLIRKLFEMEVPEIKEGILEIKAIVREPGRRSKVAVFSHDKNIGAVGTCVGHLGARIQNIVRELGPERVDIVEWSEDPVVFITHALSPAKVNSVEINEKAKAARVIVPEKELSLAIGKEGQNVRLAVKLTGWKIDIVSDAAATKETEGKPEAEKDDSTKENNNQ
ncbi:transcription termination/antitermination protein NusA [Candidatus Saganbacteria bacterium]|nr:transcription termination/antitermination protein NusA [Candidatus Saganbacteria bacterium]